MQRPAYIAIGAIYALLSVPAWWAVATGALVARKEPHLLLAFAGTPAALGFLAYGLGWGNENRRTWMALRVSWMSLAFAVFLLGFLIGVRTGKEPLMTAVLFCGVAASYLAFVALVLLLSGAWRRGEEPRE